MSKEPSGIEVRPLRVKEASRFAALQRIVFSYYNSSKLGQSFCTALYRQYALRDDTIGLGVWRGDDLLSIMIACHPVVEAEIQRALMKRAMLAALVRPHLWLKGGVLRRVIQSLPGRTSTHDDGVPGNVDEAPLDKTWIKFITMGVHPAARRMGLATLLTDHMYAEAVRQGYRHAESMVFKTNTAQRRLREKMGWKPGPEPPGEGSVRYTIDLPVE